LTEHNHFRGVTESVMVAALLLVASIFWHLYTRSMSGGNGAASAEPPTPAPMAGGIPVVALGQNAVAPDRQWLLLPYGA
jgi:hypothetical protein